MTLLDTIKDTFASEKAKARRLYSSIVRREGTPDARSADPVDLRKAMGTLGFTEQQLARDVAALAEAKRLTASIPDDADTMRDAQAARQADRQREAAQCRAKRREIMDQFRALAVRERELEAQDKADVDATRERMFDVEDARARLAALRQQHALLFIDE